MKKISFIIILISGILSVQPNVSLAQLKITLGPAVGLTSPTADYSGTPSDFYGGYYYGLKPGLNFGVMGKLNLGHININLSILYSIMGNSGNADINTSGSTVDFSQHLLTIGIGPQFGFGVPASVVIPYIGLNFLVSTINGSATFQGTSNVPSGTVNMKTATRTGLGLNGGVGIKFMKVQFDLSLRYNMINLFGKSYDGSPTGDRIEAYKYLNDAKDPYHSEVTDEQHPVESNRIIATIQFELGVMFGL
jgi:hypothetical protein